MGHWRMPNLSQPVTRFGLQDFTWLSSGYLVGMAVAVGAGLVLPQISCCGFKSLRVFLHQSNGTIASGTKQAAWFSGLVIVVHTQRHDLAATLRGFGFFADSAD